MSRRLIQVIASNDLASNVRTAKVYRDSERNEYRIVFYVGAEKQKGIDETCLTLTWALAIGQAWVNAGAQLPNGAPKRLFIEGHNVRKGYAVSLELGPAEPVRYYSNLRYARRVVDRFNRRNFR